MGFEVEDVPRPLRNSGIQPQDYIILASSLKLPLSEWAVMMRKYVALREEDILTERTGTTAIVQVRPKS